MKPILDGFIDTLQGLGGNRLDRLAYVPNARLSDGELTALYRDSAIAARAVDLPVTEATRLGVWISHEDMDSDAEINDLSTTFRVLHTVTEARRWARLYGGSLIWLVSEASDQTLPMTEGERIDRLVIIDRRMATRDFGSLTAWGEPTKYLVSLPDSPDTAQSVVHASRLIRVPGQVTDALSQQRLAGWDYSILQRAWEAIRGMSAAWAALDTLLQDSSVGVFKIKGLYEMIASNQSEVIRTRFSLLDAAKSYVRSMLLDTTEEYSRVAVQFTGLGETLDKLADRVASSLGIPTSVLFGRSPAGLNATGDSELRWLNAMLECERALLEPIVLQLLTRLCQHNGVEADCDKIRISWPPLWQPSDLERAQAYAARANADVAYVRAGVYEPEEIALSRSDPDDPEINIVRESRIGRLEEGSNGDAETP